MRVRIKFFQTLVNVDILTSFNESQMFLMASGMMAEGFLFTLLMTTRESLFIATIEISCLNAKTLRFKVFLGPGAAE